MGMKENECGKFKFRQFDVMHRRSSMKIGVDAVLLGAWGAVEGNRGLDIGCGCGVIALMAAQRNPECEIVGIDIHGPSVEEAAVNFITSPWSHRLKAEHREVSEFCNENSEANKYDFILSNPPFFNSGLLTPDTPREMARHEASLSPLSLLPVAEKILKEEGTLSMIFPFETLPRIDSSLENGRLKKTKVCLIADKPSKPFKRVMITLKKTLSLTEVEEENLFIRDIDGSYSQEYQELTREFYLWLK